jgi:hypothetical protein
MPKNMKPISRFFFLSLFASICRDRDDNYAKNLFAQQYNALTLSTVEWKIAAWRSARVHCTSPDNRCYVEHFLFSKKKRPQIR